MHESTVSQWLNDRKQPERANIEAVARALNVDAAWLAFGDSPSERAPRPDIGVTAPPAYADTAVQSLIVAGQRHLVGWLAEYSAQLLEAAATDARRQLGTLAESVALPEGVTVEGAPPEVIAAAEQAVLAKAAELAARKGKGGHVPPGTNRSAG